MLFVFVFRFCFICCLFALSDSLGNGCLIVYLLACSDLMGKWKRKHYFECIRLCFVKT